MITVIVFVWMVLYAGMLYSVFRIFDSGIEKEWFECFLWLLSFIFFFDYLVLMLMNGNENLHIG